MRLLLALLVAPALLAQSFEVATVKPSASDTKGRWIRMQSLNQFEARNHTLKTLIAAAYNVSPKAISGGPAWIDSAPYDIQARTPGVVRPTLDEQMAMLRQLLADRFQLTFHRASKELPHYALTVAKKGSKLTPSTTSPDATPQGPPPLVFVLSPQGATLPGRYATMTELASVLQRAALDRPVVDKTQLTGRYDFDLQWTPDETQFGGNGPWENHPPEYPDLFSALQQQLGLKLEAAKGPIPILIIDHAAHPSAN